MSVPVWFDRAQTAILQRDLYGGATPAAPAADAVRARPGAAAASGLRQMYVPGHGKYRSTALAVIAGGGRG